MIFDERNLISLWLEFRSLAKPEVFDIRVLPHIPYLTWIVEARLLKAKGGIFLLAANDLR